MFNTGVPYRSSIIGKPTTAPTGKPIIPPPTYTPTVAPSKPTKVPTLAPIMKTVNAAHKLGEKVKAHGSPEEAPAPVVVPPNAAAAAAAAAAETKWEEKVDAAVAPKEAEKVKKVKEVEKVEKVEKMKEAGKVSVSAEKEPQTSAVGKVVYTLKSFVGMKAGKMDSPALRSSAFTESAPAPTKSPSTGVHKPTWKPSAKPAEHRELKQA